MYVKQLLYTPQERYLKIIKLCERLKYRVVFEQIWSVDIKIIMNAIKHVALRGRDHDHFQMTNKLCKWTQHFAKLQKPYKTRYILLILLLYPKLKMIEHITVR